MGLCSSLCPGASAPDRYLSSVRATARQYCAGGERYQHDVEEQRPSFHVGGVNLDHLVETDLGATAHLPEAG